MANFNTHLAVAAVAGGGFASLALGLGLATPPQVATLVLLVTIGGILPDIDLDYSTPTQLLFSAMGLIAAFLVLSLQAEHFSLFELWLAAGFSYAVIRYPAWEFFSRYTVHRGIFHSLLALLFFTFLSATLAYHLFDSSRELAWLAGIAVGLGYLVHLLLDELYSVDFIGKRLKRSFGTALKPLNRKDPKSSLLMTGAALLALLMTPDLAPLLEHLSDATHWQQLGDKVWPQGVWFST